MATVPLIGGAGCNPTAAHVEAEAKVGDDLLRQQADQIRVAREACIHARKDALGGSRTTQLGTALEQEDGLTGARQIGGGDEPIVATTDDNGIVVSSELRLTHCPSR